MKPILYEAGEEQFKTQGIGRLSDVLVGSVKRRINGFYELRMTYPITGAFASDLKPLRMLYASHDDTGECEPFEIYSVSKPSSGKIEVLAWHNYYRLGKIVARPFYGESIQTALMAFKNAAMTDCPFTFESDVTTAGRLEFDRPVAMQSIMGGIEGSFLDVYGGEWDFNNFACYLRSRIGSDKDVTIRYGKNLLMGQNKRDTTNLWSGIVPFWYKDGEGLVYYDGIIKSPIASSLPHDMVVAVDASQAFESKPTAEQLLAWGQNYVNNNAKKAIPQSITVSFVNLAQTEEYEEYKRLERLSLGDGVKAFYEDLDIEGNARIVETDWDFVNDKYNKMVLGEVRANFAKNVSSTLKETTSNILRQVPSKAWFESELDQATKRITGATGGRKVDLFDSQGRPNGTVFIDTDTIETATKGMLINYEGIGFSTDIPNWNFNSAWTIDGTLDMQNINVIHMRANIIKAGILADVAGKNFWNMETGDLSMQSSAKIGGKTVSEIVGEAISGQTQTDIFNKLTNNGASEGIYLSNGSLYINASYIGSGTIAADRIGAGTISSTKLSTDVNNNINGAANEEQLIYISKASGTASVTAPTSWVSNTTGNQNTWTTKRPKYNSSYPVLFIAKQKKAVGGSVTCTTPQVDETTTVIDGGHITTGTIDASQVTVTNINASNIQSGTMSANRISGGSIDATNVDVKNLNASKITSGTLGDSGGNFSLSLANGAVTAKKFSINSNNFWLKEGGELTNFDSYHQTFARIDGSKIYVGRVSRSWDSGSYDSENYNDNYIIAGGINGSRTGGKLNVSTEINSWWLHFNLDGMSVRDSRDSGVYYEGGSGTVNVGGMTLTFKDGLMVTALS